jgi:hypothetical protein
MSSHFCILVTSHANTKEKVDLLKRCLISLRSLETPIILSSHIPVSEEIQELTYLTIKDSSNLILDEGQLMSHPVSLEEQIYHINDSFANILFSCSIFKKTYIPGMMNHYINSIRIIKSLGFENILYWEYDSVLGSDSFVRLKEFQRHYLFNRLEYYGFASLIQDIPCLNAIPSILNVDKVLEFLPRRPLKNAEEYNELTHCKIIEQWMLDNLKNVATGELIDLGKYDEYFSDTQRGLVGSQNGNYLNFDLRSGIFFNHSDKRSIFYALNTWNKTLTTQMIIKNPQDQSVLYNRSVEIDPGVWFFDFLGSSIDQRFNTEIGLDIEEVVTLNDPHEVNHFTYNISKKNLEFVSRLKKWQEI